MRNFDLQSNEETIRETFYEMEIGESTIKKRQHEPITRKQLDAVLLVRSLFGQQVEDYEFAPSIYFSFDFWDRRGLFWYADTLEQNGRLEFEDGAYQKGVDFQTNIPKYGSPE